MRFALIGFGAIGRFRENSLKNTPGAKLTWIAEPVAERREAAAKLGYKTSANLADALNASDVDAVIVSTPPHMHREHCEAAFAAGKHVLCEKPLATTVEDAKAILAAARRAGKTLATGYNYRFYPAIAKARELIQQGEIGEVVHVKGFAGHPGGPEFTHPWVHNPAIMGGGALMDNGTHVTDLTLHFLGKPAKAHGYTDSRVWNFGDSEDNAYVMMRTEEGRTGILHASWTEWNGYQFNVEIMGTEGVIRASYPPMMTVLRKRPEGRAKKGRRQVFLFPMMQIQERLRSYRWTVEESFIAEQLDFMGRVAGKPAVGASGEDGLLAVEMAYAAYSERKSAHIEETEFAEVHR
jgi:predicted dehydrogenase